jgi:hypothetical protein
VTLLRVPALAFALASVALPGGAQTTNPLGGGLPLTVHAQASCIEVSSAAPTAPIVDERTGDFAASCIADDNAHASADLKHGTLKVTVETQTSSTVHEAGLGMAAFYDTLTFSGFSGSLQIPLNMRLHGSFSPDPPTFPGGGDLFATLIGTGILSGVHLKEGSSGGEIYFYDTPLGNVRSNVDPITHLFPRDDVVIDMSTTFTVLPSLPVWFLAKVNVLGGGANETTDFGHTAQLSLDLPPGVTFTSTSGVFLTALAAPVPEAETAWLLLAGILPLAARLRWVARAKRNRARVGAT